MITKNTAKLDRETEELKHVKIPLEVGKIIQEGRKAKGLKQCELAAVCIINITCRVCVILLRNFCNDLKKKTKKKHQQQNCFLCHFSSSENLRETTNYNRL